ncbi:MAG: acyltransferase family protein, partial [Selenomonadaceae bacterium]|nr:acyltransferase family protein [Selenomonadaceae bacterium]
IAASIFLFMLFQCYRFARPIQAFIGYLGANSYLVYLLHPLAITYLSKWLAESGRLMTAPNTIIFFIVTVLMSLAASSILKLIMKLLGK